MLLSNLIICPCQLVQQSNSFAGTDAYVNISIQQQLRQLLQLTAHTTTHMVTHHHITSSNTIQYNNGIYTELFTKRPGAQLAVICSAK